MYTTEGIILKKIDAGEADALFTIYTKDFGKMRALAKGIKKEGAKLKGHLEPLSFSAVSFVLGKNGERLTHAELMNSWRIARTNWERLRAAYVIASLVDQECLPGERDKKVWSLLLTYFRALEEWSGSVEDLLRSFTVEFRERLGYSRDYEQT